MADIVHKIEMRGTPTEVFDALREKARARLDSLLEVGLDDGETTASVRVSDQERGARGGVRPGHADNLLGGAHPLVRRRAITASPKGATARAVAAR